MIGPILAAAKEDGMTLEALRDLLSHTLVEMDREELVTTLRRMMFSSNLSGQTPQGDSDA